MAAKDNGPVPPGAPPGAPSPGVTICQSCSDFANCEAQVAQGYIPACAGPTTQNTVAAPTVNTGSGGSGNSSVSYTGSTPVSFVSPTFWTTLGQQAGLIVVALVLVGAGFYLAFSNQINAAVKKVV